MLCVSCKQRQVNRPRCLCWHCYYKVPKSREIAPASKFGGTGYAGRRQGEVDYCGQSELPECPTTAIPGSEEKILVLQERWSRGESLWHPEDGPEE